MIEERHQHGALTQVSEHTHASQHHFCEAYAGCH